MSAKRWRSVAIMLVLLAASPLGAGTLTDVCVALRLCDPPPQRSVTIDVVCDRTATCDPTTLRTSLECAFEEASTKPDSAIRLWMMGRGVSDTTIIADARYESGDVKSVKGRAAAGRRFVEASLPRMLAIAQPAFAEPVPQGSPIAEALTVVSWSEAMTDTRIIVVITDAREVSDLGDFECHPLPDEDSWLRTLTNHRCLIPGSLDSVSVHFSFAILRPVEGRKCLVSLQRESTVRDLWQAGVERAGGTLDITSGPPVLGPLPNGGSK